MPSTIPPPITITSGPFHYGHTNNFGIGTPILQVNNISRCPSDELIRLLTYTPPPPLLTKKGKPRVRQPPPHIDPKRAFYEAQVVHYGLEPAKGKVEAKKKLLDATEGMEGGFVVPDEVIRVGREMEEEWRVKNEEREKVVKEIRRKEWEEKERVNRKRRREEEGVLEEVREREREIERGAGKRVKGEAATNKIPFSALAGEYAIAAPDVSTGWDCGRPLTMQFDLSSIDHPRLSGSFDFGIVEGLINSAGIKSKTFTGTTRMGFYWSGIETGEGEDAEGEADFTFVGEDMFVGTMHWDPCGTFEIAGKKDGDLYGGRDEDEEEAADGCL